MSERAPKKDETLEVRLPFALKAAFMARCRAEGRSASAAVRSFIESELAAGPRPARGISLRPWHALAALAAGAALGGIAGPSLAHVADGGRAAFERLDRDHDGAPTFEAFRAR